MRSYEAARNLFSFLAFCAWAVIVIGVLIAFIGASAAQGFGGRQTGIQFAIGAMPGLLISLGGLLGLALVQMGRSTVDSAEYTQQLLHNSREQLELSRQLLEVHQITKATYGGSVAKENNTEGFKKPTAETTSYSDQVADSPHGSQSNFPPPSTLSIEKADPEIESSKDQILLPPVRQEIVFKNGRCIVGGKQFSSRTAAQEHQELLYQTALAAAEK